MKKMIIFSIAILMAFVGSASAADPVFSGLNPKYNKDIVNSPTAPVGPMNIVFHKGEKTDWLALSNIRGVKVVKNADGTVTKTFPLAAKVLILSGVGDDTIKDDLLIDDNVPANGVVNVPLLDYGKAANVPFVEKIYGYIITADGEKLPLLFHASNKWIGHEGSSAEPNLETLYIGVVSYPSGHKLPVKLVIDETGAPAKGYDVPQRSSQAYNLPIKRLKELERRN